MDFDTILTAFKTVLVLMSMVGAAVWMFQIYNYNKINPRHDYSDYYYVETFFYFIFQAADILASGNSLK